MKDYYAKENMQRMIDNAKSNTEGELRWALFKLDDKPHQFWERMLAFAYLFGDDEAAEACKIMLEIGKTPEEIRDALK